MTLAVTNTKAILTDTTLCTGCESCVRACKEDNDLPADSPRAWKRAIADLSSTRYTTILRRKGGHNVRQQCRHCLKPACASACIVGALTQTDEGAVVYDKGRCMGCRYCMVACPYGVPRYEWERAIPAVRKCDFCADRIAEGNEPACTEACPEGATIFGTRRQMLAEAHRRIDANPSNYINKVFGETEVGGTSVLYISDIPLGFLGWKDPLGETPMPDLTWEALSKVPPVVVGMGTLMAGTWWVIDRKMAKQAKAAAEAENAPLIEATEETTEEN